MHVKVEVILVILAVCFYRGDGLKILGLFPIPAKSHYNLGSALMKGLAGKGHDVTLVSSFETKNIAKEWKYRDIVLTGFADEKDKGFSMFDLADIGPISNLMFMNFIGSNMTERVLDHPKMKNFLKSKEKFDIVIMEQFVNDALKALAHHFGAPLIMFSTMGANSWLNPIMGNPAPTSYIPELLLHYPPNMNLWQRLVNSVMSVIGELNRHFIFFPKQKKILQKYLPNAPDFDVVNYNVSLVLLNSHTSTNQPVPLTPNMIEIGGFHVTPAGSLPKDLQDFLDNAKEGVVYFSMGSNLKTRDLPVEKRNALLKVFSKLKQKVLWKWEDDVLPGQPPNVKLQKWFPQQEILAHKNIKAFITHGGLLSTIETIYHGVPILAIPIFGDQIGNAELAEYCGYGKVVKYQELNEENLLKGLNEVLNNPKYTENAKRRSQIMHDRPLKPMDTANYWVEYVARHGGATHFRSAALDLRWYQYMLLDVILVIALALVAVAFIIVTLCKLCCRKKTSDKQKKQ